jgi:hypothetical protein
LVQESDIFAYGSIALEKGYTQDEVVSLLDTYPLLKKVDCTKVLVSDLSEGDTIYVSVKNKESNQLVASKGTIDKISTSHETGEVTIFIGDVNFTLEKTDTVISPK